MRNKGRIAAAAAAFAIAVSAAGTGKLSALSGEDVINDKLDEYQQDIVSYIFVKNYISGNISLSDEFKKKLDTNDDGVINIMDSARLKKRILDYIENNKPAETTEPPVTSVTDAVYVPKKGDYVTYSGDVHFTASGKGNTVKVSGVFKIVQIIQETEEMPYGVQLENTGWVSYASVSGGKQPSVTEPAPEKDLFDGKKLEFVNAASGKYLASTGSENGSNIIQTGKNYSGDSDPRNFKAASYYNSGSYRLYSECSDKPMVIDIVKDDEKIKEGCNVQLYDAVDPVAQTWKIEKVKEDYYKIVSASNPDMALTVIGSGEGSAENKNAGSEGNVFLSKYDGLESQLWKIKIAVTIYD